MEPTYSSASNRLVTFAIVVAIGLFTLLASKVVLVTHRPVNNRFKQEVPPRDHDTARTTDDVDTSNKINAASFTSMEAEFEWNQFMVPDYNPGRIDPNRLIERTRDTERRFLEEDLLRSGTIRGPQIGN